MKLVNDNILGYGLTGQVTYQENSRAMKEGKMKNQTKSGKKEKELSKKLTKEIRAQARRAKEEKQQQEKIEELDEIFKSWDRQAPRKVLSTDFLPTEVKPPEEFTSGQTDHTRNYVIISRKYTELYDSSLSLQQQITQMRKQIVKDSSTLKKNKKVLTSMVRELNKLLNLPTVPASK